MKINRNLISVTLWVLASAGLVVLLGFTGHRQSVMPCSGLEIRVVDHTGNLFIEPKDIRELLNTRGSKVKGTPMSEVDLGLLEKLVYTNPYVSHAEVYSGINGVVHIDVWQRNPIMRVINVANEHFYIDEDGGYFPVSGNYTAHVVVASGLITDGLLRKGIDRARPFPGDTAIAPIMVQLNEIAWFIRNNELWNAQIEQVFVNENSEIELIPRVGDHAILLGNTSDLALKMKKLLIFYTEAVTRKGWGKYDAINLKYKDQVICSKTGYHNLNQ